MMQEKKVITLSNGGKYLLLHEIGELIPGEGKKYFFAIGVTPDYDLDSNDIIFLVNTQENGEEYVEKVDENDEVYGDLAVLELTATAINNIPGYKEKLKEEMKKIEESGN